MGGMHIHFKIGQWEKAGPVTPSFKKKKQVHCGHCGLLIIEAYVKDDGEFYLANHLNNEMMTGKGEKPNLFSVTLSADDCMSRIMNEYIKKRKKECSSQ